MRAFVEEMGIAIAWRQREAVAMVWVYYDESGEYGPDGALVNMSVAGCVAPLAVWQAFCPAWQAALAAEGLTAFHMTDFEAWKPPFDFRLPDGARDKAKHNRLLNSLLDVMLNHVRRFVAFAAGCPISAEGKRAHSLAVEDCIGAAIKDAVLAMWPVVGEPLNLVFGEQKHFGYGDVMRYRNFYEWGEAKGRIKTVAMGSPADILPLQAADILAYEMAREQRDGRPRRYPFQRLVDGAEERGLPMTLEWNTADLLSRRGRG